MRRKSIIVKVKVIETDIKMIYKIIHNCVVIKDGISYGNSSIKKPLNSSAAKYFAVT